MFGGSKCLQWAQCFCRKPGLLVIILLSAVITMPYLISNNYADPIRYPDASPKYFIEPKDDRTIYLVRNPKCEILDRDPLDPSIREFVKKEKFEACRQSELLTKVVSTSSGGSVLRIDEKQAENYVGLSCCAGLIHRAKPTDPPSRQIDSEIILKDCIDFKNEVNLPEEADAVLVRCKAEKIKGRTKKGKKTVYDNVHPVFGAKKVRERLERQSKFKNGTRKLSVLIIGLDNVSRLNLERSMPKTTNHLRTSGWTELQGYNKMGENTYPNLMAILTGMNSSRSYKTCAPTKSFGLDNCPFIWSAFRNAGYVTAYGEDSTPISTFNYMKVGFVNPPTDYYLRPYLIAAENHLPQKLHLGTIRYCTGPEPSADRILNYAMEFARTFVGAPYFGFFWTNTMSHDDMNGISSVDDHILDLIKRLDKDGILNDTMVVFLSDHGIRYGIMRETLQGWYEEKLPFNFVWLPEWFRDENPESFEALRSNGRSLTSPYNLHETLRDVLIRAGGEPQRGDSCPQCQSLFSPVPPERGCDDVGVSHHWCACTAFGNGIINGEVALEAGNKIVRYIENIAEKYKDSDGKRMCAPLKLKKIIRVQEVVDSGKTEKDYSTQFMIQVQATPGDGRFEATVRKQNNGELLILDDDVSRINTYSLHDKCLKVGEKQFCFCT